MYNLSKQLSQSFKFSCLIGNIDGYQTISLSAFNPQYQSLPSLNGRSKNVLTPNFPDIWAFELLTVIIKSQDFINPATPSISSKQSISWSVKIFFSRLFSINSISFFSSEYWRFMNSIFSFDKIFLRLSSSIDFLFPKILFVLFQEIPHLNFLVFMGIIASDKYSIFLLRFFLIYVFLKIHSHWTHR